MDLAGMIALPGVPANGAASAATSPATGSGAGKDGDFMAILAGATGDAATPPGGGATVSAQDAGVLPDAPILSLDAAIASLLAGAGFTPRAVLMNPDASTSATAAAPVIAGSAPTGEAAPAAAPATSDAVVQAPPAAAASIPRTATREPGAMIFSGAVPADAAKPAALPVPAKVPALIQWSVPGPTPVAMPQPSAPTPMATVSTAAAAPAPSVAPGPAPGDVAIAPLRAGRAAAEDGPHVATTATVATAPAAARGSARSAASGSDAGSAASTAASSTPSAAPAAPAAAPAVASAPAPTAPLPLDPAALPDADLAALVLAGGDLAPATASELRSAGSSPASAGASPAAAPRWTAHTTTHLAVQMARRAEAGVTNFAIRLDPAELGRIEVRLSIGADQRVRASLTVERPETLAEVMRASRDLVDALADAGLSLDDGALSVSLDDRSSRRGAPDRDTAAAPSSGVRADPETETAPPPAAERWSRGRIDLSL